MSTYWYFECLEHDPPILDDNEFTQHTDDWAYKRAVELARHRPINPACSSEDYFDGNARRFLRLHAQCRVRAHSEYNEVRELECGAHTDRWRCDLPPGHDGDHSVTFTWSEP